MPTRAAIGWVLTGLLIVTSPGCQITQPVDVPITPPPVSGEDADALLRRAAGAAPREAAQLRLEAAERLHDMGSPDRAYAILTVIDPDLLDANRQFQLNRLAARVALDRGDSESAWRWIRMARPIDDGQGLARDLDVADIARARGDYVTAAHVLMGITPDTPGAPSAQQLNDDIWDTLRGTPSSSVAALAGTSTDPVATPWWQLAASMDRAFDVAAQRAALSRWQSRHPGHPATSPPPTALVRLARIDRKIDTLGVFLPLSGPLAGAGGAVRDGIAAAYFHADTATRILLYDTHGASLAALYEQALADRVDLIIGPLDKSRVAELHGLQFRQIPILALNYLPASAPAAGDGTGYRSAEPTGAEPATTTAEVDSAADFFEFGLAIEDEARVIAERVAGDGANRVLILLSDVDWSERAADAFLAHWQGGEDSALESARIYDVQSLTDVVGSALHIDASDSRMRKVAAAVREPVEFVPRRRRDIDAVVALVNAQQGDAVRPALAYHFASDIPVYATSQITSGRDTNRLTELNAMRVCQLPWAVYPDPVEAEFRSAFERQTPGPLHALGVDAYRLADRLTLLASDSHDRLLGATGVLTLHGTRVNRELIWAIVRDGRLEPLPIVVN